jgi:1,4-alpha-glucan branching enzyme
MIQLFVKENSLQHPWCNKIFNHGADQALAFERGNLVFIFNFNPNQSFTDYGIAIAPGKFEIVLNTDNTGYGGNGLVDETMQYHAVRADYKDCPYYLKLYLPSRTGLVLKRLPIKKVR